MRTIRKYFALILVSVLGYAGHAQDPNWTVDPAQFSNSMIVVGEIHIDKQKSEDVNDQIAAFIGGDLVGVANLRFESVANNYLALLSVYSNATSGSVSFKMYDSSADAVVDVVTTVDFVNNGVIGTGTVPYLWSNVLLNSESKLLGISFEASYSNAVFDGNAVSAALKYGADLSALKPVLTLSDGAKAYVDGEPVASEVTALDFTEAVTFEVVSEDEQHSSEYVVSAFIKNDAPSAISLSNASIDENNEIGELIGEFTAIDDDQALTYSLVSGSGSTGNSSFSIVDNQLFTASAFNYEVASSYSIRVQVSDIEGQMFVKNFNVTVNDLNETPQSLSLTRTTINENLAAGTAIGVMSAVDQDANEALQFSFTETGEDNGYFIIDGTQLKSAEKFNFEEKSEYQIELAVTDKANNRITKSFTISVIDQNDAPTGISLDATNILENISFETVIGNLSVADEDKADIHLLSLISGEGSTNNNLVYLSGSKLLVKSTIDFEQFQTLSFRLKAVDIKGAAIEQVIVIDVIDILDSPIELSKTAYAETVSVTDTLGVFSIRGYGDGLTFVLSDGVSDNQSFQIKGEYLTLAKALDYETKKSYVIRVVASDDSNEKVTGEFSISVVDSNDPPTAISLSNSTVAENRAAGEFVGKLTVTDQDKEDIYTYSVVNSELFTVSGDELITVAPFDFEKQSKYNISVRVTDAGGLSFEKAFEILISDMNDSPTDITLSSTVVQENLGYGTVIGTLSTVDQDATDTYEYTLVSGTGDTDNNLVFITGNSLMLRQPMDFEVQNKLSVRVKSRDKEFAEISRSFAITVKDILDSDILIDRSRIPESTLVSDTVGLLSVEDQTVSFDYEFIDGFNDNDMFILMGDYVTLGATLDFETRNLFYIDVSAKNNANEKVSSRLKIYVADVNEVATDIYLTKNTINENAAGGGVIGLLKATDVDAGDTHQFSIAEGSVNSELFEVDSQGFLKSVNSFNFEANHLYNVTITAADKGGLKLTKQLQVTVVDQNDAPVYVKSLETFEMYNGYTNYIKIEESWFTDEDVSDSLSYQIFKADGSAAPDWITTTSDSAYLQFIPKGQGGNTIDLKLVATDKAGASAVKYFDVTFLLISAALSSPQVMVYPNPTTDFVVIPVANSNCTLYDLKGAKMQVPVSAEYHKTSLDLRNLNTGIYLLQFEQNGQLIKTKIIKN